MSRIIEAGNLFGQNFKTQGSLALRNECLSSSPQYYEPDILFSENQKRALGYNPEFDTNEAIEIRMLPLYEQMVAERKFREKIKTQLYTDIGERLNVGMFELKYDILEGGLWGENMNDSMMTVVRRGRDYRRENGNPADFKREDAEVDGFEKIEALMADGETGVGSTILLISPRGREESSYQHNFYDIFAKNRDGSVSYHRFSSGLNIDEYRVRLSEMGIDIQIPEDMSPDEYFLANPIVVPDNFIFKKPEKLHEFLHKDHEAFSKEEFDVRIKPYIELYGDEYVDTILNNPWDRQSRNLKLNGIINIADFLAENGGNKDILIDSTEYNERESGYFDVNAWGEKPVQEKMQGCGFSGGYEIVAPGGIQTATVGGQEKSPYSVMDFGRDKVLCCTCPFCKKKVEAVIKSGTIKCPECSASADWKE